MGVNRMDADSRPLGDDKYTPLPSTNAVDSIANKITRSGRKNGKPKTSTPAPTGSNATAAAPIGTVGTSRNFAPGKLFGRCSVSDVTAEEEADSTVSTTLNHEVAREMIAATSPLYGPERTILSRNVGIEVPSSPSFVWSIFDSGRRLRISHCVSLIRIVELRSHLATRVS